VSDQTKAGTARNRLQALVLSPSATHPADYGNRNRVCQIARFLKQQGYEVHFVLYPMEEDWAGAIPPAFATMCEAWNSVQIIPPSRPLHQLAAGAFHSIDEWWDPAIGDFLKWLFARRVFDLVLVNYPFLSKALEYAPARTVKVMDVHDIFTGRKEMLEAAGVAPEFFYTTLDQERIAFDRADIVVAIKESEQGFIVRHTRSDVVTVTFFPSYLAARTPAPAAPSGVLRVGFIGALNSVNSVNMNAFLAHFARIERYYAPAIEIRIAGNVCSRLHVSSPSVTLLGRVKNVDSFYASCDVIVAPLLFSTGLKIKVGEALGFGLPVVATQNAFDGFPAFDEYHTLPDLTAVGHALVRLSYDRHRLEELRERSRLAADLAARRTEDGLNALGRLIAERRRRILFVTDQPFWKQDSFAAVRLHQWAELSTYLMRTTVVYVGSAEDAEDFPGYVPYDCVGAEATTQGVGAALAFIYDILASTAQVEVVLATSGFAGSAIAARLRGTHARLWLDLWMPPARDLAAHFGGWTGHDIAVIEDMASPTPQLVSFDTVALRYLPAFADELLRLPPTLTVVVALCGETDADRALAALAVALFTPAGAAIEVIGQDLLAERLETGLRRVAGRHGRPGLLLAVGEDCQAAKALAAIAGYGGFPFARVSSCSVPRLWPDADGTMRLRATPAELLAAIAACPRCETGERAEATDTGWSSYWHKVSAVAQRSRS
jgi:glycosyltransferase involved in cell wall biosynthesis